MERDAFLDPDADLERDLDILLEVDPWLGERERDRREPERDLEPE